jgi:hypothetical protein
MNHHVLLLLHESESLFLEHARLSLARVTHNTSATIHKFIHMIILSFIDSLLRPSIHHRHPHKAIRHHHRRRRRHMTQHGQNRCCDAAIATVIVATRTITGRRMVVIPPADFASFLSSAVEEDGFCGTAAGTSTPAIGQVLASKSTQVPSPSAT